MNLTRCRMGFRAGMGGTDTCKPMQICSRLCRLQDRPLSAHFFKTVLFCMQMSEPLKREFWVDQSELNLIESLNQSDANNKSVRTQKCQPGELQDFMLGKIF